MIEKIKKNQRAMLVVLIVICMGVILVGGLRYLNTLRQTLRDNAIQNVMTVTKQQQQAFDNFIDEDRARLRSYAEYFSTNNHSSPEESQHLLTMFKEVDAIYSVVCLDDGWLCSNTTSGILQLDEDNIEMFRSLQGSGILDAYIDLFSGAPRFGYYETFTFGNGHRGVIQKSYDRSKVSEAFSLSFYNDQGLAYIVNQSGDIFLRSVGMIGDRLYTNILDVLNGTHGTHEDIGQFMQALQNQETGSIILTGDMGSYVYTYVPVVNGDDWYLVSIVPMDAISTETDKMLHNTQLSLVILALMLVLCGVFVKLIWRTHKDMEAKDEEVKYQAQLFDIFVTYLSRNSDDIYLMLDVKDRHMDYISPNLERIFGIPRDRFRQEGHSFEITYSDGEPMDPGSLLNLEPGTGAETLTVKWVNPKTRETKWFQASVYCVQLRGRSKLVFYVSDRTKEHQTQASLSDALHMAQAANEAKSTFLSNVSHDIRTPMNAIIGFLALMRDEADNPAMVIEYTQRIDAASQHLLGLINDVLDMNKIESGGTSLSISEMNMAEVIDEINTIIRPQAREKEQTFDIYVSHLKYEHLMGDKLRVNQILINLLSNAVKYTPAGGAIQLRVEELPQVVSNYSRIRITVSDNGLGMSEDYQKVIFDPFTREETKVTHEIQGTGLGMAITKSLVDLMGGTIHVESELGKGSTFTVELELSIQDTEDDPDFWKDHRVTRMIVADDDEDICKNIVKTMAKTGVAADYATDGYTAIEMMRTTREAGRPYDLILLDWKMPTLNGLETARLIRKNYSNKIPILLFTAYDWGDIEQEAMEIGVNHFMPKPFFMSTFKSAIRRVMGNRKESDSLQTDVVRGMHILVVDDIEVNRIILDKILTTLGATCDLVSNGQEAVDAFTASQPDDYNLILMDVQMPVLNGYEATRAIRTANHPSAMDVPIIAMTANAFVDDVREALESGMDAHIAKPVQIDKLKSTIQQVLDARLERA